MIGVLYEHPEWFEPLFAELERRGLPYTRVLAHQLCYDPASERAPYQLLFNRMSPSAYLRDHGNAIFAARQYLAHMDRLGVATINGSAAYNLELSKARQLDLLSLLKLPAPRTRVVNAPEQVQRAASELEFPLIIKPNVGGSGALMQRFDSMGDVSGAPLDDLFGIDGTALVQEYHQPRESAIVRVEVLNGQFLYAIRIHNDPNQGFNLCPADICQVPDESFDVCPADAPAKPPRKIEAVTPPEWIREAVIRLCTTAGLDLGGVEYLESERDGATYFYDINSLSNFVTDAPNLVGFDPFVRLGDLVEARWMAARHSLETFANRAR
jgi:RimK-like ATP-grasp domain